MVGETDRHPGFARASPGYPIRRFRVAGKAVPASAGSAGSAHTDAMSQPEPRGPVDASLVPRYAGLATFARLPERRDVDGFDVAIVGVPFDSGVSYRPGARFGPAHIRQSSRLLRTYNPALDVSPFGSQQVVDAGDLAVNPFDIQAALGEIEAGGPRAHRGGWPATRPRR